MSGKHFELVLILVRSAKLIHMAQNVEGPESFQHSSRRDSRDVYNVSPSGLDTLRRDDGMRQAAAPQPKSFRHSRRDSKDVYNVSPDPDIMPLKGQDLQIPADGYMPRGN